MKRKIDFTDVPPEPTPESIPTSQTDSISDTTAAWAFLLLVLCIAGFLAWWWFDSLIAGVIAFLSLLLVSKSSPDAFSWIISSTGAYLFYGVIAQTDLSVSMIIILCLVVFFILLGGCHGISQKAWQNDV